MVVTGGGATTNVTYWYYAPETVDTAKSTCTYQKGTYVTP
jgi:hypothetical protein